jgi:hypothetical protein
MEQITQPKKRGRKPGSKNKTKRATLKGSGNSSSIFAELERELGSMLNQIHKAQDTAARELERLEIKHSRELEKQKAKLETSANLWKNRAKEYRKKLTVTGTRRGKVGRPASASSAKRGRPVGSAGRKGGGRKKAGELTKRDIILSFVKEQNTALTSRQLIDALFLTSGENDRKRFSQGVYTTLTLMYNRGDLKKKGTLITLA